MKEAVKHRIEILVDLLNNSTDVNIKPIHQFGILHIDEGHSFFLIRGGNSNSSYPRGYLFLRVGKETGNIYAPTGRKIRGSIYSEQYGLEYICKDGLVRKKVS